ncbi:MAG: 23S rRNA (adenine(2503)-C(2))-methyltransferase RlmN [candidate division WOR-3 bacterium]|nr:MAG: 23S rRNA (adenine(2503)-C(2))-methyltransferase RlmN [candidate division WOR-3 bacterium]
MKHNLKGTSLAQMRQLMTDHGHAPYRGDQIFQWIWQKHAHGFTVMTNLSKDIRVLFAEQYRICGLTVSDTISSQDGAVKYMMTTEDNHTIETVFITEEKRTTVCVSTQVGCPLNCSFCATGLMGFTRNLRAYEIADQVRTVQEKTGARITNIVLMGMGEPLLNVQEVLAALEICCAPNGLGISQRHTTLSTAGIIDGMKTLLASSLKVKLAVSLNFPDVKMRTQMMPVTKSNPLAEVLNLARAYSIRKSMVTFEYVLIDRINDRIQDARLLLRLIKGIRSKINLIPYNPHPRLPYRRPDEARIARFHEYLLDSPHTVTLRRSKGQEIMAACGQLCHLLVHSTEAVS